MLRQLNRYDQIKTTMVGVDVGGTSAESFNRQLDGVKLMVHLS
ncbi:MAG: hypothetical protein P8J13_03915 [Gammaproteobacteria bacterium]|nr:hypothetical protein [Gammaproteobacteria bacterium]